MRRRRHRLAGTGGNVVIDPAPSPSPSPSPTPTPGITPASGCPTIADPQGPTDGGTITGPTGTYRVCMLPSRINKSITLTKIAGLLYQLPGRVDVGTDGGATASANDTNVKLTIDPGVIVYADTGVAWLAVNRGNKINAVGTATRPIIFTSRDNVLGLNADNSSGQWDGVVLMGRAPVTDCTVAPDATPGTAQCERQTEGAVDPAYYGGATATDSSGQMSFVQIRYSGYVLSANGPPRPMIEHRDQEAGVVAHVEMIVIEQRVEALDEPVPLLVIRATPSVILLDDRLRLVVELVHYSHRFADIANSQRLPGYSLVNVNLACG